MDGLRTSLCGHCRSGAVGWSGAGGTVRFLIGATLGGGVHDMIILFASIRRGGKTLGQMVKNEIGPGVGLLALVSVLAIMIILLAVLALVVVQALAQSPWGVFTIAV